MVWLVFFSDLVPGESNESGSALKIGVVLSGGQAPGGHNVIYLGFLVRILNFHFLLFIFFILHMID